MSETVMMVLLTESQADFLDGLLRDIGTVEAAEVSRRIGVARTDAVEVPPRRPTGWEYDTTDGPRKAWTTGDIPPAGDGWEPDYSRGRAGEAWDRFDYHEEAYWRRWVGDGPRPTESGTPYLGRDGKRYSIEDARVSRDPAAYPFTWDPEGGHEQ